MELQRVLAHDTRKAMEKVYELYGEDAMVVSNSRTHNQTELVVAIDLATQAMDALSETPLANQSPRREALGEMPNFDTVLESHVFGEKRANNSQKPLNIAVFTMKKNKRGVQTWVSCILYFTRIEIWNTGVQELFTEFKKIKHSVSSEIMSCISTEDGNLERSFKHSAVAS